MAQHTFFFFVVSVRFALEYGFPCSLSLSQCELDGSQIDLCILQSFFSIFNKLKFDIESSIEDQITRFSLRSKLRYVRENV